MGPWECTVEITQAWAFSAGCDSVRLGEGCAGAPVSPRLFYKSKMIPKPSLLKIKALFKHS